MSIAVESDLFILPVFKMLAPAPVSQQQTYLQPPQQYPYQPPPQIISPQDPSKQYAQVSQIKYEKIVSITVITHFDQRTGIIVNSPPTQKISVFDAGTW